MHVGMLSSCAFRAIIAIQLGFWDENKRSMVDLVASLDHHRVLHPVSCAMDLYIKLDIPSYRIGIFRYLNLPNLRLPMNQLIALESHVVGPSANCQSMSLLASSCWKTANLWFLLW